MVKNGNTNTLWQMQKLVKTMSNQETKQRSSPKAASQHGYNFGSTVLPKTIFAPIADTQPTRPSTKKPKIQKIFKNHKKIFKGKKLSNLEQQNLSDKASSPKPHEVGVQDIIWLGSRKFEKSNLDNSSIIYPLPNLQKFNSEGSKRDKKGDFSVFQKEPYFSILKNKYGMDQKEAIKWSKEWKRRLNLFYGQKSKDFYYLQAQRILDILVSFWRFIG
jgi:hypothetical protein